MYIHVYLYICIYINVYINMYIYMFLYIYMREGERGTSPACMTEAPCFYTRVRRKCRPVEAAKTACTLKTVLVVPMGPMI